MVVNENPEIQDKETRPQGCRDTGNLERALRLGRDLGSE
jgi:hypothetical protein